MVTVTILGYSGLMFEAERRSQSSPFPEFA
jgi:hypothetical protein